MPGALVLLAERLQRICVARAVTVSLAESCTGGLVAATITEVAGASGYFLGGVVSYANEAKEGLLDVPAATLRAHGAVSAQTARAMATGARVRFVSTLAASVTGIAGPDGGSTEKPVGLVYVGLAGPAGADVRRLQLTGDRQAIREGAARVTLEWLVEAAPGCGAGSVMTRTASELGAGLAPARDPRPIRPGERIHILGIAGAGASAAALLAKAAGAIVTGCDPGGPSPYTRALEAARIPIEWSHNAAHVGVKPPPDRLAVTKALTAVSPDHPELRAARARGMPVESWQQVVADAATGREVVAVAGTHGKSTTSGWLTWLLAEAGLDPSAFVGALLPAALTGTVPATARLGHGAPFVIEADEYAGNFDPYRPSVAVVTTVEWDHPDVFADRAAVSDAFAAWLDRVPAATVVANLDDDGVRDLLETLQGRGSRTGTVIGISAGGGLAAADRPGIKSVGPGAGAVRTVAPSVVVDRQLSASIVERSPSGTVIDIDGVADGTRRVHLPTVGDHNVVNAMAALGAAIALGGADPDRLLWALGTFPGIGRRLERKGEARGVVVYDDYGHHPTAIRATLAALREREPGRRAWAVYEPLTFHRTAAMLGEFADALAEADAVAIADIWASRDPDTLITSPGALAAAVRNRRPGMTAYAPGSVEATAAWLAGEVREGDAVLVMGGGRSYRIAELLLEALQGS